MSKWLKPLARIDSLMLRPFAPDEVEDLYRLNCEPGVLPFGRYQGAVPSLDSFSRDMMVSRPDEIHLVATDAGSDVVLAHTTIYNVVRYRHAYVSVLSSSDAPFGTGVKAWIGVALYGFAALSLRKVYAEVIASHLNASLRLVSHLLTEEGRLRGHVIHRGRDDDLVILSSEEETLWRYVRSMGVDVSVLPERRER